MRALICALLSTICATAAPPSPADAFSQALFREKGNVASVTNVWAMEIEPGGCSPTNCAAKTGSSGSSSICRA